jgi:hypothetical protein
MARFSPTDAVFTGFRFARERPATILVWAAYYLVATALALAAMANLGGDSLGALPIAVQGAHPDPQQLMKLMNDVLPAVMFSGLVMVVLGAVLSTAILRVRMTPGPHPWGGLRLGGGELKLLAAKALVLAAAFVVEVAVSLLAAMLEGVGVPGVLGLSIGLALLMAPLMIRLSLAGVVSQAEGRINPARSFQLTQPLFWRLLGAYVLLGAIMLVILVLVTIIFTALLGAVTLSAGGNMDQMAMALLQGRIGDLNPLAVVVYITGTLVRVWVAVVATVVFLSIAVDAYQAGLREQK